MARRTKRGFTLIELLLVIGVMAVLAAIVIVAINPAKQLGDARNAQRRSDIKTILDGLYQYAIDNSGTFPVTFQPSENASAEICGVADNSCTGRTSIRFLTGTYLSSIPADPQQSNPTSNGTDFAVWRGSNSRFTVKALTTENNASISVTR